MLRHPGNRMHSVGVRPLEILHGIGSSFELDLLKICL